MEETKTLKNEVYITLKSYHEGEIVEIMAEQTLDTESEPINENEIDTECNAVDEMFESERENMRIKVKSVLAEKQSELGSLTPEERARKIRAITLQVFEDFKRDVIDRTDEYVRENWDRLLESAKKRKALMADNIGFEAHENFAEQSKVEPEKTPNSTPSEATIDLPKTITNSIESAIKIEKESNSVSGVSGDVGKFEIMKEYGGRMYYPSPDYPKLTIVAGDLSSSDSGEKIAVNMIGTDIILKGTKANATLAMAREVIMQMGLEYDPYQEEILARGVFNQYFITDRDLQRTAYEEEYANQHKESESEKPLVMLRSETVDTVLPNGNKMRTFTDDGTTIETDKVTGNVVKVNGITLPQEWHERINVQKNSDPFMFVQSGYYNMCVSSEDDDDLVSEITRNETDDFEANM